MYTIYHKLKEIAEKEFEDIVSSTNFIGGRASAPNKLRIYPKKINEIHAVCAYSKEEVCLNDCVEMCDLWREG